MRGDCVSDNHNEMLASWRKERTGHPVATLRELDMRTANAITGTKPVSPDLRDNLPPKRAFEPDVADMVNLPSHYARFPIEPIRYSIENGLNGFQFNINKYSIRAPHKHKDGGLEDISKVIRYAIMFYKHTQGNPDWWRASSPEFLAALDKELTYNGPQ